MGSSRELSAAAAILTGLALLVCGPALFGSEALLPEDWIDADPLYRAALRSTVVTHDLAPIVVDLPRDLEIAHALRAGRLALWNPLSACGAPLWAEQGGPFFPLKLPFYLAPSARSYAWFLTLRVIAAGLGAYGLARARGLPHFPALVAAATFQLSGAMLDMRPFGAFSPLCMLPWVVLGAFLISVRVSTRAVVGAALALGITGLGGHPPLILLVYAVYAVAIGGHVAAQWRSPRRAASIAGGGALAALLGVGLAAPALLPLAELTRVATSYKFRDVGPQVHQFALLASRSALPLALFAPNLLAALLPTLARSHLAAAVVGVSTLTLAIAGLRRGLDAALLAIGLLGLALAVAPAGLGWVGQLPGLDLILPFYTWALVSLPLTQAAGAAVMRLDTERGRRALLFACVLVLAVAPSLLLIGNPRTFRGELRFDIALRTALDSRAAWLRLMVPFLVTGTAVASCYALRAGRPALWCPRGFAAIAVAELMVFSFTYPPFARSAILADGPSPTVRFLQQRLDDGGARFTGQSNSLGRGLTPMLYGLADARGMSALPIARYLSYVSLADPKGLSLSTIQALPASGSALVDLAAVRYIAVEADGAVPPPTLGGDPQMPLVFGDRGVAVYENRAALPRARIVHRARLVADFDEARAAVEWIGRQDAHATELGLADTVILEPAVAGAAMPQLAEPRRAERVQIVDQSNPEAVIVAAELDAPGMIMLADTYYPGWTATVDGEPASIYPANLLFRAVFAPAGRHTVIFRYAPRSLTYGWWIAAGAAVCSIILLMAGRRAR
jgi:hypothetical protein